MRTRLFAGTNSLFYFLVIVSANATTINDRVRTSPASNRSPSLYQSNSRNDKKGSFVIAPREIIEQRNNNPNVLTGERRTTFYSVVVLSVANILFNTLRPDPAILWQFRIPRILWELSIGILALSCSETNTTPASYFLLSIVTVSTALVDIFFWSPVFAFFATFKRCTGGGWFTSQPQVCETDNVRGVGRLLVSAQALFGGLFYLQTAIIAWGAFITARDVQVAERNAQAMANAFGMMRQTNEGVLEYK